MHRTQLLLEQWQYDALRAQAARQGTSLSALVRSILSRHLDNDAERSGHRLSEIQGIAEGPPDLAANHDDYLYGAPNKKTPRKKRR